ncbi:MMPL family transporter [Actinomadura keratinilytica]|uniref:MMPL family transporter n=1 Tax=Actinomadura keratinilytica TaxID=547461 RepID=A0ABP7Y866_9ACTN
MAVLLHRLGRFAFRRRRLVVVLWLVLLGVTGAGAATLSGTTTDTFSIPGTEAQRAMDRLAERFPEAAADGATARIVFAAPGGRTLNGPAERAVIERVVRDLRGVPRVASVAAHTVNPSGTIAFTQVTYKVAAPDLTGADRRALKRAAEPARAAGLTVEMGGEAAEEPAEQRLTEAIGLVVAGIVLIVTFGSLVAAGLPLLTAVLGIAISVTGVTAATGFVDLNASTPTLAVMLGLAVAIDYSLFIVSRYRHERASGHDGPEAAGRALATAGSAVVFAGLTVVIALAALAVVGIPVLTQMGLAAAAAVVVAVLIALTLIPALLGFAGRRVRPKRRPDTGGMGTRWAGGVIRHPVLALVAGAAALLVVAVPALDLRLGLPDDGTAPADTTQRKAYDLLAEGFGEGFNGPLILVVDVADSGDRAEAVRRVSAAVVRLGHTAAVTPPTFNRAGDTALLTVIPDAGPSSRATEELVSQIRAKAVRLRAATGADIAVTGRTALDIDMSAKLADAFAPYLGIVVGLAFLLLTLVFRSILVPLTGALGFLLSIAATFGAVVAVFQWGWLGDAFGAHGPILSAIPIFLVGVVFGLAMDYQVFLVSRVREGHAHGEDPSTAVRTGVGHGARVITAAAVIMVAVFSGFMLSPDPLVKSIGFALASATVFDAFVVRMTVMPAVLHLLGRAAWWLPAWLDRLLPDIDVEGARLTAARTVDRRQPYDTPVRGASAVRDLRTFR